MRASDAPKRKERIKQSMTAEEKEKEKKEKKEAKEEEKKQKLKEKRDKLRALEDATVSAKEDLGLGTRSLRNLRSGQQRLENLPDDPVEPTSVEEKEKTVVTNGDSAVTNGGEQAASRGEVLLSKLPSLEGETVWLSN